MLADRPKGVPALSRSSFLVINTIYLIIEKESTDTGRGLLPVSEFWVLEGARGNRQSLPRAHHNGYMGYKTMPTGLL
jgi:hypothetical protein